MKTISYLLTLILLMPIQLYASTPVDEQIKEEIERIENLADKIATKKGLRALYIRLTAYQDNRRINFYEREFERINKEIEDLKKSKNTEELTAEEVSEIEQTIEIQEGVVRHLLCNIKKILTDFDKEDIVNSNKKLTEIYHDPKVGPTEYKYQRERILRFIEAIKDRYPIIGLQKEELKSKKEKLRTLTKRRSELNSKIMLLSESKDAVKKGTQKYKEIEESNSLMEDLVNSINKLEYDIQRLEYALKNLTGMTPENRVL